MPTIIRPNEGKGNLAQKQARGHLENADGVRHPQRQQGHLHFGDDRFQEDHWKCWVFHRVMFPSRNQSNEGEKPDFSISQIDNVFGWDLLVI